MITYSNLSTYMYGISLVSDNIIRKQATASGKPMQEFMETLITHVIHHPNPMIVPVFGYKRILNSKSSGILDTYTYQYDMMRLGALSANEKITIDYVANAMDSNADPFGKLGTNKIFTKYDEFPALMEFLYKIYEEQNYWDIHRGNILKDLDENYRLIDLEGYLRTPLELNCNDWISRRALPPLEEDWQVTIPGYSM